MSDNSKTELGFAIAELILAHGVPAAMQMIAVCGKDKPTAADIRALRDLVPEPSSYLKE